MRGEQGEKVPPGITREAALKRLKELSDGNDAESDHMEADNILLSLIGDKEITDAYNDLFRWYA